MLLALLALLEEKPFYWFLAVILDKGRLLLILSGFLRSLLVWLVLWLTLSGF